MFTQVHYPKILPQKALDRYLARGWFRMGQMIFTCHFLCFNSQLYTSIWTRLDLENYFFRKSLRKLIKRNTEDFNVQIRKAVFDEEKERLYQKHKTRFEGYVADSLRESLFGESSRNIYETFEVAVYDGKELVACSFFDLGETAIASIMGLFDPSYQKFSLGFFTMLMEISFGIKHQKKYYYPGYIVPGYPNFDYKRRVGELEFYDSRTKTWLNISELKEDYLLSQILEKKLKDAGIYLQKNGIPNQRKLYPLFDKKLWGFEADEFLQYPLFINCYPSTDNVHTLTLEYDLFKKVFRLYRVLRIDDASVVIYAMFEGYDKKSSCLEFLLKEDLLIETDSIEKVARIIKANKPFLQ